MPERPSVDASLEAVLREERTRLIAALVRILGDWDVAEELVQDAAVAALRALAGEGIPDNPGAWLMTTRAAGPSIGCVARHGIGTGSLSSGTRPHRWMRRLRPVDRWRPMTACG